MNKNLVSLAIGVFVLLLSACGPDTGEPSLSVPGGDPARGQAAFIAYGCESCHMIPGVTGTRASVGPPLDRFSYRRFVAGELQNTPDNLIKWIMTPQSVEPGSVMPDLHVTEQAARDMASYLESLK